MTQPPHRAAAPAPETAVTPDVDLRDLRAFGLVVDLGSITSAARALGETKGSISRRLTRLERALGVVLLQRSPRRVQATEDGAAYRARLARALELLDDANAQAQQARTSPHGHLRVTAPTDIGTSVVAPMLARFLERYPEITVETVLTEARLDFDAHQIDVALRATGALQDSSLVAHKLAQLEFRLYAAPSYVAKHGAPRRPDALARHRMLVAITARRGQATLTLRRRDETRAEEVRVRAALSGAEFGSVKEAAAAGGGVALLPVLIAQRDVEQGRLVPLLKDYVGDAGAALYLVHHGSRFMQPKVRAFRDFVLAEFGVQGRR